MARSRRRRKTGRHLATAAVVVCIAGLGGRWLLSESPRPQEPAPRVPLRSLPLLTTDRPEGDPGPAPDPRVAEKGSEDLQATSGPPVAAPARAEALIEAGRQAQARGDLLAARAHFSDAMQSPLSDAEETFLRAELTRLGQDTVFSARVLEGDPWVARYVVEAGDTLGRIASKFNVTPELLATINQLRDKNMIRLGQALKIVQGPFHAIIHADRFTLDVYLGKTFVRSFRVGLGAEGSTPRGEWKVATKLVNPTYYPPRGGQIIAADDPQNPLGERWIGLEGVGGEAMGQLRYGIHGTIEPETIGRNASLGCVRMFNEDVELLYTYLVEKHSTVVVR